MSKRGVSLVELVSVLAILGAMILLILPALLASVEVARAQECQNDLKQRLFRCSGRLIHEVCHNLFIFKYLR